MGVGGVRPGMGVSLYVRVADSRGRVARGPGCRGNPRPGAHARALESQGGQSRLPGSRAGACLPTAIVRRRPWSQPNPMPFFYDPLYLLLTVPALLLSMWAQFKVQSTFKRYSQVGVRSGMTGAEAAAAVMRSGGVAGVGIERHQGFLSDHYDPTRRVLRLSPDVHDGRSVASIAVAAHEAGHSIQDKVGYMPLALRSKLVPLTNIGSRMWIFPFIAGAVLAGGQSALGPTLMMIGVAMFAAVVLFQLVTLPTEFDASNRAKMVLASSGIVTTQEEALGVSKVLSAAAMTYVAAAASSVMTLIYLILRTRDSR